MAQDYFRVDERPGEFRPFLLPSVGRAEARPGLMDLAGAYWRQENPIGALLALEPLTGAWDPEFDATPYVPQEFRRPEFATAYARANTIEDVDAITRQIRRELQDRETMGQFGFLSNLGVGIGVAGVLDPTNLLPFAPAANVLKGARFLRRGYEVAKYGLPGLAAAEGLLYATQETRTPSEMAFNLGAGTLMMGLLGGAITGLKPREAQAIEEAVKRDIDFYAGEKPGQAYPAYKPGTNYPVALPASVLGGTAVETLDRALALGYIDEGTHRLARYLVTEVDPDFDVNSTLEIVDAVRTASREIKRLEGLPDEATAYVVGEAASKYTDDGLLRTAIKLYRGHDGDTVVEEWYHRFYDQVLDPAARERFAEYHRASGDTRSAHEHFAQQGRDYFFSQKLHEKAGPLKTLFRRARETLRLLIQRIRGLRGAQIPKEIEDLFRRGGMRREDYAEWRRESQRWWVNLSEQERKREARAAAAVARRDALQALPKKEVIRLAKEQGIPIGNRGKKVLVGEILAREGHVLEEPRAAVTVEPERAVAPEAEVTPERTVEPARAAAPVPEAGEADYWAGQTWDYARQYAEAADERGWTEAIRAARGEGLGVAEIAERIGTNEDVVAGVLARAGDTGEDVMSAWWGWRDWLREQAGDEGGGEAVGYQVRRAAAPTKDLASDPDYVYHATNAERAMDIAQGKLRTHKPWENTDQDAWPDGSVEKRAYFSESAAVVWHFAPEFGEPVVLRIKKSAAELKKESITGDIYTKKTIDARHIEILGEDGEWYPVKQFYAEPGNVGYQVRRAVQGMADEDLVEEHAAIDARLDEIGAEDEAIEQAAIIDDWYKPTKEQRQQRRVLQRELDRLADRQFDLEEEILARAPRTVERENAAGRVVRYESAIGEQIWVELKNGERIGARDLDMAEYELRQAAGEDVSAWWRRWDAEAGRPYDEKKWRGIQEIQEARRRAREGTERTSYQTRGAAAVNRDVQSRMDPDLDDGSRVAPIRGLSPEKSERILRFVESVHPGARVFFTKFSPLPGRIAEGLVVSWERLRKNLRGEGTAEAAEILKRRELNRYQSQAERSIYNHFVNTLNQAQGRGPVQEASFADVMRAKWNWRSLRDFKRAVGLAMMDLEWERPISKYAPGVQAAARELSAIMTEIGRRAQKVGQLSGTDIELKLAEGATHFPRIWRHEYIRRYRGAAKRILRDVLGPDVTNEDIDAALNSISGSPTGSMGYYDLSEAQDAAKIDTWKSKFFERRELQVDHAKLLGVQVQDARGNPITIDFVETDALRAIERYLDSTMGSIVLAEKYGDVTMAKEFQALWKHYDELLNAQGPEVDTAPILRERDAAFKDLLALRDMINGTYARTHGWDPGGKAMRASKVLMNLNAMLYLGGVVLSSLADVARPMFHWGLEYHVPALAEYASVFRTEAFARMRREMRDVWGAALSAFNHERLFAIGDIVEDARGDTAVERGVRFLADQMGLLTGMDLWNSTNKEISGYVALHAVLDVAGKVRAASERGVAHTMDAMSEIVPRKFLVHIGQMGLGLEDLVGVARQVEQFGEKYGPLTLTRTDRWSDLALRSRFESAMVKEIDQLILTPSVGDKPLWAHWGILQHAYQFKSFGMAGMRGVMIQGLQDMDLRTLEGILASTAIGAGVYYLKALEAGRDPSDNPAEVLLNAIDKGGLTAYLMDVDSMVHRVSQGTFGVQSWLTGEGAQRFSAKSTSDIVFGPTVGTLENMSRLPFRTIPHALTGNLVQGDETPVIRLTPYSKAPYIRWLMERMRDGMREALPTAAEREAAG